MASKGLYERSLFLRRGAAVLCLVLAICGAAGAQSAPGYQALSTTALDKLVGPVALYPDPMLVQVFEAAKHPDDVAQAAEWLKNGNDAASLGQQPCDPSVAALANYPTVLNMMAGQVGWTTQLGQAYQFQSKDVLSAVQRLRRQAKAQGNLASGAQQKVVVENNTIQIVPASPEVIYVPTYNPTVVYTQPANPYAPLIAFSAGLAMGSWMSSSSVDWYGGTVIYRGPVYYGPVHGGYWHHGDGPYYAAGPHGYGAGWSASGTGPWGNEWKTKNAAGGTWNGGTWTAHAQSNEWANGAKTGSYRASGSGPNGAASARGWGYENGDKKAGAFSKTVATDNGIYNIPGGGATNGSDSRGKVTVSGVNREGDYGTKTWSGNDGNRSSWGSSGNVFSGSRSGSEASAFSSRGFSSRSGERSFGGGGFGGFGGGRRR